MPGQHGFTFLFGYNSYWNGSRYINSWMRMILSMTFILTNHRTPWGLNKSCNAVTGLTSTSDLKWFMLLRFSWEAVFCASLTYSNIHHGVWTVKLLCLVPRPAWSCLPHRIVIIDMTGMLRKWLRTFDIFFFWICTECELDNHWIVETL